MPSNSTESRTVRLPPRMGGVVTSILKVKLERETLFAYPFPLSNDKHPRVNCAEEKLPKSVCRRYRRLPVTYAGKHSVVPCVAGKTIPISTENARYLHCSSVKI
jgi:hypothetical protein